MDIANHRCKLSTKYCKTIGYAIILKFIYSAKVKSRLLKFLILIKIFGLSCPSKK